MTKNTIVAMLVTTLVGVSNAAEPKPFENAVKLPKQNRPWSADLQFSEAELRRAIDDAKEGRISGELQLKIVSDLQTLLEQQSRPVSESTPNPFRTWTSGDYSVSARLISANEDGVLLERRDNGEYVNVELSNLSYADRRYVSAVSRRDGDSEKVSPKSEDYSEAIKLLTEDDGPDISEASTEMRRYRYVVHRVRKAREEAARKLYHRYLVIYAIHPNMHAGRALVHGYRPEDHGKNGRGIYPIWVSPDSKYWDLLTGLEAGDVIKITGNINYHIRYSNEDERSGYLVDNPTYDPKKNWYVHIKNVSHKPFARGVGVSFVNPTFEKVEWQFDSDKPDWLLREEERKRQ